MSIIGRRLFGNRLRLPSAQLRTRPSRFFHSQASESDIIDANLIQRRFQDVTSPMWIERLLDVQRASAAAMIPRLASCNGLGYRGQTDKVSPLLQFLLQQRAQHPDKVLLVRVGEFFECYGFDAVMLVEHCGLNPMGMQARAGCPRGNVQQTCDQLTNAGLSVAVYEEAHDVVVSKVARAMKHRFLAQVVSPSNPVYTYGGSLRQGDIEERISRPCIGIRASSSGYMLVEVYPDELLARVSSNLTSSAVRALICPGYSSPSFGSGDLPVDLMLGHTRLPKLSSKAFVSAVVDRVCTNQYKIIQYCNDHWCDCVVFA